MFGVDGGWITFGGWTLRRGLEQVLAIRGIFLLGEFDVDPLLLLPEKGEKDEEGESGGDVFSDEFPYDSADGDLLGERAVDGETGGFPYDLPVGETIAEHIGNLSKSSAEGLFAGSCWRHWIIISLTSGETLFGMIYCPWVICFINKTKFEVFHGSFPVQHW